jgi:hypothetical protein
LDEPLHFSFKRWKPFFFWAACLLLSMQGALASESGKWDRLLLVPGYFGKGLRDFPELTASEQVMIDSLGQLPYMNKSMVVIQEKGEYYCFIRCFLGVYRWDGEKWILYSGGKVTGYNCSSYEFFQEEKMYQFSGRGYWQSNSDLFSFGEYRPVEFVRTINQPADYYGWLKFKTDQGIFSLFGIIDYDKIQTYHLDPEGYFLDFQNWTWKKARLEFNDSMKEVVGNNLLDQEFSLGGAVETRDYALLEVFFVEKPSLVWLIFDKRTAQVYSVKSPKFFFEKLRWMQSDGNQIRFLTEESFESMTLDLSVQVKSALLVGSFGIKEDPSFLDSFQEDWLFLLVEAILVVAGLWLFWKVTKGIPSRQILGQPEQEVDFSGQFSHWLKALSPYAGQLISQTQLEEIVGERGIINQDLRKVRRSRAIKALNEHMIERHGKPIILRIRDEQDKRIIRYRIEDYSLTKPSQTQEPMNKSPL